MRTCSACREENSERARFCQVCGTALTGEISPGGSRKTVTVLFCDLVGSTRLGERLDPETLRLVLDRYFDEMRGAAERHGGTVEKFIGDAVLAVFGVPRIHEDDALRAVRAADEMRTQLLGLNEDLQRGSGERLQIRVGIHTGQVMAGERGETDRIVTGDPVNVAARLEQTADPDQIVMGEETYELVRDAVVVEPVGSLELKGKAEPTTAYRVLEVVGGAQGRARRLDSPMVGRERALSVLRNAFDGALADEACCLVTVLGPAGVGKSRLVEEFLADIPEAAVYRGRCLPYGEGTFFPVVEVVKQATGPLDPGPGETFRDQVSSLLEDDEHRETIADRVAQLAGVSDVTGSEEIVWAIRRFFEALARRRPLVVVLDDLQWGGSALLDLVEHVADFSRGVPLLLLAMARPDLLDARPGWGGGKLNAFTISLEPLSAGECDILIENLLGSTELDADVRRRIADAAGGTPLFVEEMLAKLIDDDLLRRSDGRWVPAGDLSDVPVPATISALLAARIDQLRAHERSLLERAAVGGAYFFAGAVRELSDPDAVPHVDECLTSLLRKDLIRPDRSSLPGEDAYRFRHMLIRDATYEATPKRLRAELHERYASWLQEAVGAEIAEQEEILGYHLEQALSYRAELHLDRDPELVRRAVAALAGAGRRASGRLDFRSSSSLLERAAVLLPDDDPERIRLMADVGVALNRLGEDLRGEEIFAAVIGAAHRSGDVVTESRARIDRLWAVRETEPARWLGKMRAEVEPLIPILREREDDLGLTKGLQLLAAGYSREGQVGKAEPMLQAALDHARRVGDALEVAEIQAEFLFALPLGPTPVEEAMRRVDELTLHVEPDLRLDAWALGVRAQLEAMRARFDEARILADREEAIQEELGLRWSVFLVASHQWMIEMLAGRPEVAEHAIRSRLHDGASDQDVAARWAFDSHVALALLEQGRFSEARDRIDPWAGLEGGDRQAQVAWCGIRARTAAELGDRDEAERIAREGVAVAATTDELNTRAESLVHLAWVFRRSGDGDRAAEAARDALELYERKGNIAAATQVRAAFAG
jgi:class 3 adenylate cyclase/tetratricopeptide (TPR) repeat protein